MLIFKLQIILQAVFVSKYQVLEVHYILQIYDILEIIGEYKTTLNGVDEEINI